MVQKSSLQSPVPATKAVATANATCLHPNRNPVIIRSCAFRRSESWGFELWKASMAPNQTIWHFHMIRQLNTFLAVLLYKMSSYCKHAQIHESLRLHLLSLSDQCGPSKNSTTLVPCFWASPVFTNPCALSSSGTAPMAVPWDVMVETMAHSPVS